MPNEEDEFTATRWSLIERLKNFDDAESWREFFERYWRLIYAVAVKAGLTHDEAEEVVQETVIGVQRKIAEFETHAAAGSFKAWLLHSTRWRIADQFERRARRDQWHASPQASQPEADTPSTPAVARIPDPAGNPLEALWDEEWQQHVTKVALDQLKQQVKAKQYRIFFLHVVQQQPLEMVKRALGVSAMQVYLAKNRLLPRFKRAIAEAERGKT